MTHLPAISFRQVAGSSRQAGLLPAGYSLVSGSSSRRVSSRKTISGRLSLLVLDQELSADERHDQTQLQG
jgi:hypothetical protein